MSLADKPLRAGMSPGAEAQPRQARAMLARDADSIYWMARYVERAEHIARLLLVNANSLVDVGDLEPSMRAKQWQSILSIMRLGELADADGNVAGRVAHYMTLDSGNSNSIVTCLTLARENARSIRENISSEMWENLNTLYWSLRGDDAPARFEESADDLYRMVTSGSMLFQGLTDQTLPHDQRWLFTQLGKYMERIDITSRVIEIKFELLQSNEQLMESTLRNLQLMALLRSCCSIEAYRRHHMSDMDPIRVVGFLLLEKNFPRSVRFSVSSALAAISAISAISGAAHGGIDPAERILGRLDAQLEYAEIGEILAEGVQSYLQRIQGGIYEAAASIQQTYFPH